MHLFLAGKLKENPSASYLFGNLLPDVEHLMKPREELVIDEKHQGSGHTHKDKFLQSFNDSLREGIQVHFLVDEYIHNYYIPSKICKFKKWEPGLVHFMLEVAMDRAIIKREKYLIELFDQINSQVKLESCGRELEKIFPRSKHPGSVILKDGLEMLRIRNLTSYWKMFKIRRVVRRYNPFKHIDPNPFSVLILFRKLEKEAEKDLDEFIPRCLEYVRDHLN